MNPPDYVKFGRRVIALEAAAVGNLRERIDASFEQACQRLAACAGRIVVTGMGKSGHVGGKIAATLASTGSPAFFVHPGEASHGDLGMITAQDMLLAISNSGETPEILTIVPMIKRMGVELIAMTGNLDSTLARQANVCLDVGVPQEACPVNLAPTSSTTATLAMGDALAMALFESRGSTEQDFARSHPGGALGRRLLLYVGDVMHEGDAIPLVHRDDPLPKALLEMSGKGLGMTGVVDDSGRLVGIFTDGDLRRALNRGLDFNTAAIGTVMTAAPKTATTETLAAEVVQLMRTNAINGLFVLNGDAQVVGALNMHDLLRAGVV